MNYELRMNYEIKIKKRNNTLLLVPTTDPDSVSQTSVVLASLKSVAFPLENI